MRNIPLPMLREVVAYGGQLKKPISRLYITHFLDELVSEVSDPTVMLRPVLTGSVVGTLQFDSTFCMAIRHLSVGEEHLGLSFARREQRGSLARIVLMYQNELKALRTAGGGFRDGSSHERPSLRPSDVELDAASWEVPMPAGGDDPIDRYVAVLFQIMRYGIRALSTQDLGVGVVARDVGESVKRTGLVGAFRLKDTMGQPCGFLWV